MRALRERLRLPRWVVLAEADNELPLDFDNVLCVETLVHLIKGREEAQLIELLPGPDQLCVRGPEGRFTHELVVPFARREQCHRPLHEPAPSHPRAQLPRTLLPGDEWLYTKLYAGPGSADHILRQHVRGLLSQLSANDCDRWFFLRYGDPDWHLRLRFHGTPAALHARVLPALERLAKQLDADGHLWRLQIDTYDREIERYGGPQAIELVERIFHADSEAALAIVENTAFDEGRDARWRLALLGAHRLLCDFELSSGARLLLVEQARDALAREHRVDTVFMRRVGERFRGESKSLLELLCGHAKQLDAVLNAGATALARRSAAIAPHVAELRALERSNALGVSRERLAASLVHMHMNRVFRSAARTHELVTYEYLRRLYEAERALSRRELNDDGTV